MEITKIGFIGLGRMGFNMALNLLDKNYKVVVYNRSPDKTLKASKAGAIGCYSYEEFAEKLGKNKIIWIMVKSGKPVDDVISGILPFLNKGDIIIDGGNSFYKDSIRRAKMLKKRGISFLDCGVSGGVEGARNGACMMIGGNKTAFKKLEKMFKDLCVKDGYAYVGNSGAGHFVKMVHNGIEYGMMGAIAEGFAAIKKHSKSLGIDIKETAKAYSHGSIIEGKLMDITYNIFKKNSLNKIKGIVPKGETEDEMKFLEGISKMNILKAARLMRVRSRKKQSFEGKIISAMRKEFGGHKVVKNG